MLRWFIYIKTITVPMIKQIQVSNGYYSGGTDSLILHSVLRKRSQFNALAMLKQLSVKCDIFISLYTLNICSKFSENSSAMLPYAIFSPQPFPPGYWNSPTLQRVSFLKNKISLGIIWN